MRGGFLQRWDRHAAIRGSLWLAAVVIAWAASVAMTHHGCHHSPPPLASSDPPDPGTPRAGYCGAVDGTVPYVGLLAVATGPTLLASFANGKVLVAVIGTAAIVATLTVGYLATTLDAALMI